MAHRLVPEAESDLDDIWLYIAKRSGSMDIADRLVDSISDRFYLCHATLLWGVAVMKICVPACEAFQLAST